MSDVFEELPSLPNQTWNMGVSSGGVKTRLVKEDNQLIIERTVDAQPLADDCAEDRAAGGNWNEGRLVGSMPAPVFWHMVKQGTAFDAKAVHAYFRENPQLVRFDKYIRDLMKPSK